MSSPQFSAVSHQLWAGCLLLFWSITAAGGCASPRRQPLWVYYPDPPDPARAVHLVSFNRLDELVEKTGSWVDFFRGVPVSPWIGTPKGIAFKNDTLYVCDTQANCVHLWNLRSGRATILGDGRELLKPVAVAVGESQTVYVADTLKGEVLAFDRTGQVVRRFKPAGRSDYRPVSVACRESRLYVAEPQSHRVDVFSTKSGELINSIGRNESGQAELVSPVAVSVGPEGKLFVADMMRSRIQVFDASAIPIRTIGRAGRHFGSIGQPKGLAVSADGIVFIADAQFGYVHLFNDQGQLLMLLGGPHDRPGGTPLPGGVAVSVALPDALKHFLPSGFLPRCFLWVSNMTGSKRMSLFAIGSRTSSTNEPE